MVVDTVGFELQLTDLLETLNHDQTLLLGERNDERGDRSTKFFGVGVVFVERASASVADDEPEQASGAHFVVTVVLIYARVESSGTWLESRGER